MSVTPIRSIGKRKGSGIPENSVFLNCGYFDNQNTLSLLDSEKQWKVIYLPSPSTNVPTTMIIDPSGLLLQVKKDFLADPNTPYRQFRFPKSGFISSPLFISLPVDPSFYLISILYQHFQKTKSKLFSDLEQILITFSSSPGNAQYSPYLSMLLQTKVIKSKSSKDSQNQSTLKIPLLDCLEEFCDVQYADYEKSVDPSEILIRMDKGKLFSFLNKKLQKLVASLDPDSPLVKKMYSCSGAKKSNPNDKIDLSQFSSTAPQLPDSETKKSVITSKSKVKKDPAIKSGKQEMSIEEIEEMSSSTPEPKSDPEIIVTKVPEVHVIKAPKTPKKSHKKKKRIESIQMESDDILQVAISILSEYVPHSLMCEFISDQGENGFSVLDPEFVLPAAPKTPKSIRGKRGRDGKGAKKSSIVKRKKSSRKALKAPKGAKSVASYFALS